MEPQGASKGRGSPFAGLNLWPAASLVLVLAFIAGVILFTLWGVGVFYAFAHGHWRSLVAFLAPVPFVWLSWALRFRRSELSEIAARQREREDKIWASRYHCDEEEGDPAGPPIAGRVPN